MFLTYCLDIGIYIYIDQIRPFIHMYNKRAILNGSNHIKSSMNRGYYLSIQKKKNCSYERYSLLRNLVENFRKNRVTQMRYSTIFR